MDRLNVAASAAMFHRFDNFNDSYNPMGAPNLRGIFMKTGNKIGPPQTRAAEPFSPSERDRASPKKSSLKIALHRETLYRESQKILIPHPRLVSPMKLGLALS